MCDNGGEKRPAVPAGLVRYALHVHLRLGLDIVMERDRHKRASRIAVPYNTGRRDLFRYEFHRRGNQIAAWAVGRTARRCRLTRKQERELLGLYHAVDEAARRNNRMVLRLCT